MLKSKLKFPTSFATSMQSCELGPKNQTYLGETSFGSKQKGSNFGMELMYMSAQIIAKAFGFKWYNI